MPKPTRTPERISLPGGWNFRHHNAFEYDYMLFRPTGKPQDYAGWTIAQAKAFAAAMNDQHYGVSRITDPEYRAAQKELNRIRAAEVTALQSPAGEWRDKWIEQLEATVRNQMEEKFRDSGLSVEGARIHADVHIRSAKNICRANADASRSLPPAPTGEV